MAKTRCSPKRLDAHNLIINVSEAKTAAELRVALEELEIEYVFVALLRLHGRDRGHGRGRR